jgi:hypothetical protein
MEKERRPGGGGDNKRLSPPDSYCPSPLFMHSFCILNQVIWYASIAATDDTSSMGPVEGRLNVHEGAHCVKKSQRSSCRAQGFVSEGRFQAAHQTVGDVPIAGLLYRFPPEEKAGTTRSHDTTQRVPPSRGRRETAVIAARSPKHVLTFHAPRRASVSGSWYGPWA